MEESEKENPCLSIYNWSCGNVDILKLKEWVDCQIENGNKTVKLDISWGYYNDIDGLDLIAQK